MLIPLLSFLLCTLLYEMMMNEFEPNGCLPASVSPLSPLSSLLWTELMVEAKKLFCAKPINPPLSSSMPSPNPCSVLNQYGNRSTTKAPAAPQSKTSPVAQWQPQLSLLHSDNPDPSATCTAASQHLHSSANLLHSTVYQPPSVYWVTVPLLRVQLPDYNTSTSVGITLIPALLLTSTYMSEVESSNIQQQQQ